MAEHQTFLDNHRGPFRLQVIRPFATKPGFFRSEWLQGTTEREEVQSEANAYLTDPRDTVVRVNIWSRSEQQFIGSFKRES